jgi:exosortase/archaeosortase family protein
MKRFIALYFLFLGLLFILFYANTSLLSSTLNEAQTQATLYALNLFLAPGQMQGIDIWIDQNYKIIINQACNGMIPLLFLYASILAYPASFLHKIIWMIIGYVVFFVSNVLRILLVVHSVEAEGGRGNFYWSHDLLGNILLVMVGLMLFVGFMKTSKKH